MPRPVQAWGCVFACGHRLSTNKKSLERHERTCFANPEKKACKTCKHDCIEPFDRETGTPSEKWCEVDARPEGKEAIQNCPAWEHR